ncbi:MAG TPA: SRPBCC family protein [Acidimicrobiales bacterium]|nr:SRPBCC family protein [Acidimicrobiales bacterium]
MEEQVVERAMIRATPEDLFAILTEFESYPSWSSDVKAVRVLERDDEGRGTKVVFRVAAFGRSTSPTLAYDYGGAPFRLSWAQVAGDLTRRYDGSYSFEASTAGDAETEVRYQITVDLRVPLPGFVKRRAESLVGVKVLRELKARAEG